MGGGEESERRRRIACPRAGGDFMRLARARRVYIHTAALQFRRQAKSSISDAPVDAGICLRFPACGASRDVASG